MCCPERLLPDHGGARFSPLDAVQDISIDLQVAAAPGSGTNGNVDNQTVVYRYPPTGVDGSTVNYPYQYTAVVG